MKPILSVLEFNNARAGGRAILITDKATGDVVHKLPCSSVTETYFRMKVITNGGKNGAYFELTSLAAMPSGARRCPKC